MSKPLRSLALSVLRRWETGDDSVYAESLIDGAAARAGLPKADRAYLVALVFGVVRNRLLLDAWLATLLDKRSPDRLKPDLRSLFHLALCDLHILGTPPHAAVNEAVASSPQRLRGLANAVLRRAAREADRFEEYAASLPPEIRFSHPAFLVERWSARCGSGKTLELLAWDNRPAPVYLRISSLTDPPPDAGTPGARGEPVTPPPAAGDAFKFFHPEQFDPESLSGGPFYAQDPSTAVAPTLLAPRAGERVLDACAAPGGKTALLAELMGNDGEIVASDANARRLARLKSNLERLGVTCADSLRHDWAASPAPDLGTFDAVLVDVPCSNTGVLRRRVDARWRLEPDTITNMTRLQLAIAKNAARHLRPGGRLVYSTCSLEPEENDGVVEALCRSGQTGGDAPQLTVSETRSCNPLADGFDGAFAALLVRDDSARGPSVD